MDVWILVAAGLFLALVGLAYLFVKTLPRINF